VRQLAQVAESVFFDGHRLFPYGSGKKKQLRPLPHGSLILGDSLVVMNSLLEYEGLGGQVQMI
jgi:hypothetical protein